MEQIFSDFTTRSDDGPLNRNIVGREAYYNAERRRQSHSPHTYETAGVQEAVLRRCSARYSIRLNQPSD